MSRYCILLCLVNSAVFFSKLAHNESLRKNSICHLFIRIPDRDKSHLRDSILVFAQSDDRGYGHWRFAGVFAVAQRQSECGRNTCKVHVSQPVNIDVCWTKPSVIPRPTCPNYARLFQSASKSRNIFWYPHCKSLKMWINGNADAADLADSNGFIS
jgi:hypothetical protein